MNLLSYSLVGNKSSVDLQFSSVHSLNSIRLFATPWITARQASLSITSSQGLPKLMSIESVIPPSHLNPLSSPSPPAPNPSQLQGLFQWVNSSHEVGSFFLIHSDSFYLFIGTYRPFMFKMIIGCIRIISTIFVTIFYLLPLFFIPIFVNCFFKLLWFQLSIYVILLSYHVS